MRRYTCKRSNRCKPYKTLNDFYVANHCRENMHGTNVLISGCKWYTKNTRIKTKDPPQVFVQKNLHFKTKKRRYLYK